jgi:hypothetical protein
MIYHLSEIPKENYKNQNFPSERVIPKIKLMAELSREVTGKPG